LKFIEIPPSIVRRPCHIHEIDQTANDASEEAVQEQVHLEETTSAGTSASTYGYPMTAIETVAKTNTKSVIQTIDREVEREREREGRETSTNDHNLNKFEETYVAGTVLVNIFPRLFQKTEGKAHAHAFVDRLWRRRGEAKVKKCSCDAGTNTRDICMPCQQLDKPYFGKFV
jgi:hypothetical protein